EDYYLVHEHLNGNNNPVYFSDFISTARDNHLQYVADSEMRNSLIDDLQPALRETIEQQQAPVDREQLIDFFTNRRFRKSILCRSSQTVSRAPDISTLEALFFLGQIASHDPFSDQSMAESIAMQFKTYEGVSVTVNHPALKLLLRLFILKPGVPLSLNEIRQELEPAGLDFNNPVVRDFMNQSLLTLVMRSFLRVTPCGPWFNQLTPEQPKASALVRHQAGLSNLVTRMYPCRISNACSSGTWMAPAALPISSMS
ncbi:MAG: methyltransferase regulatory domain-containing protein, partial [Proteobacteria bacterium]|nr:methyltransferase regulatory domain-containing protein [Pseudomonadota bacterium]